MSAYEISTLPPHFTDVTPGSQRHGVTLHPAGSGGAQTATQAASLEHHLPAGNGV